MKKTLLATLILFSFTATSFANVSIMSVRNQYTGTPVAMAPGTILSGVVISDLVGNNTSSLNVFIQDTSGGICVRFTSAHTFAVGDIISVDVSNDTLSEYNGLIQISKVLLTGATNLGNVTITPRVVTVADILNNMSGSSDTWESTLVTINNCTISPDSIVYKGNDTITDATGSIIMYTRSVATFALTPTPTGNVSVTGIVSDFNLPEIFIRDVYDVVLVNAIPESVVAENKFNVFPNPATGLFKVTSKNNFEKETPYKLIDVAGRVLKTGNLFFSNSTAVVDVTEIPKGMYILSVGQKNNIEQIKVVLK